MTGSHDTDVTEGGDTPASVSPETLNPVVGTCSQCGLQLLHQMPEYVCKNPNCPVHLNLPSKPIC